VQQAHLDGNDEVAGLCAGARALAAGTG